MPSCVQMDKGETHDYMNNLRQVRLANISYFLINLVIPFSDQALPAPVKSIVCLVPLKSIVQRINSCFLQFSYMVQYTHVSHKKIGDWYKCKAPLKSRNFIEIIHKFHINQFMFIENENIGMLLVKHRKQEKNTNRQRTVPTYVIS